VRMDRVHALDKSTIRRIGHGDDSQTSLLGSFLLGRGFLREYTHPKSTQMTVARVRGNFNGGVQVDAKHVSCGMVVERAEGLRLCRYEATLLRTRNFCR
jgi:hypothetical protein